MEIKQIDNNIYYISGSTNLGLIIEENQAILIDSGLDKGTARKILRLLFDNDLTLKAIVNTHSHADHCGGNHYLREKVEVKIFAPEIEKDFIETPYLEPFSLFSGASPLKELKNKFLQATPARVDQIIALKEGKLKPGKRELTIIPLPGHSINQIGIVCDGVFFCADSLFSSKVIQKHKIPFFIDIRQAKETLLYLEKSKFNYYLPAHANLTENIANLAALNLDCLNKIEQDIIDILKIGQTTEGLIQLLLAEYEVKVKGIQQFYLLQTTINAFLSYLQAENQIKLTLRNNLPLWQK